MLGCSSVEGSSQELLSSRTDYASCPHAVSGESQAPSRGPFMLFILGSFTEILRKARFQPHSVHRGELVQMTSDPNRGEGCS